MDILGSPNNQWLMVVDDEMRWVCAVWISTVQCLFSRIGASSFANAIWYWLWFLAAAIRTAFALSLREDHFWPHSLGFGYSRAVIVCGPRSKNDHAVRARAKTYNTLQYIWCNQNRMREACGIECERWSQFWSRSRSPSIADDAHVQDRSDGWSSWEVSAAKYLSPVVCPFMEVIRNLRDYRFQWDFQVQFNMLMHTLVFCVSVCVVSQFVVMLLSAGIPYGH